ncbi:MAG: succinate dehydrogenase cytochrome b subunit [Melioribacteraceae bacterium]
MGWLLKSLNSSIGKKIVMAVTGLSLILFLVLHLINNILLYAGRDIFNANVAMLDSVKPFVRVVEVIFALIFFFHIYNGIRLWFQNRKAASGKYAVNASSENSSVYSRTMMLSGSVILIFLISHLATIWRTFNFGMGHAKPHDYYGVLEQWFTDPFYSLFYVVAMILLGFHLNHAFQSMFQTFGLHHKKYSPLIEKLGTIYAIVMAVGFASIPIFFYISSLGGN